MSADRSGITAAHLTEQSQTEQDMSIGQVDNIQQPMGVHYIDNR